VPDGRSLLSNRIDRAYGDPSPRRPDRGGAAFAYGSETTAVAPWSPGFRTEVEVIAFRWGDKDDPRGGLPFASEDAAIVVGGLVYGYEVGRWRFQGIKEAYVKSNLDRGYVGFGQVLAIRDSDANLIQRNLHASVGRRTFRIAGVCQGMVARRLRRYLTSLGNWGASAGAPGALPIHPLDLRRQVDTRGWVMERTVYSSTPGPQLTSAAQSQRPRAGLPQAPAQLAVGWLGDAFAFPKEAPTPRTPALARPSRPRDVRDAFVGPLRTALANGRAVVSKAVRRLERQTPVVKARTHLSQGGEDPTASGRAASTTPGGKTQVRTESRVRSESRPTVRMQLRPPSRPPLKLKVGGVERRARDDASSERKG